MPFSGLKINLKNNKIIEIPQKAAIEYMKKGGKLGSIDNSDEPSAIDLSLNPLFYPPRYVYEEGNHAVKSYLEKYPNSMVDPNNVSITLIGNQEAGKTSICHKLAGKISSAEEIKIDDRTQVFDVQSTWIEEVKVDMRDIGGHEEYVPCLALLGRDEALNLAVINPPDLKDESSLESALWSWMEKLLEVSTTPHLLIVISKMDTVDEEDQQKEKECMRQKLVAFLEKKLEVVKDSRECKKAKIEENLEENEAELEEASREGKLLESCPTASMEKKQEWLAKESECKARKLLLQNKLSNQIHSINHLPNFNLDCITFVSSMTGTGFDKLEKNILKAIDQLPKIKLQKHWMKTVELLLTSYHDKTHVLFEDLLKMSDLSKEDLIEMLKALSAMGRVIWSMDLDKFHVIFHKFDEVSIMMKSFNYHGMHNLIVKIAESKKVPANRLTEKYAEGQLPEKLVASMFEHITLQLEKPERTIKIDYGDLKFHDVSTRTNNVLQAFLSILVKRKVIMRMDDTCEGMKMIFSPDLLLKRSGPQDQSAFIQHNISTNVAFELQVYAEFESTIGKMTFTKSCISTLYFMEKLAELTQTSREHLAKDKVLVAKTDKFEIVLHHNATYHNGRALGLRVRALYSNLLPDMVWVLLRDLLLTLNLDETDCFLECIKDDSECEHGSVNFNNALESSRSPKKKKKHYKCEPKDQYPTQLAIDIIGALHSSEGGDISPFTSTPTPKEDLVESENLMSVLLSVPIEDKTKVKRHPVFEERPFNKMIHYVRPLRQLFDDLSAKCSHGKKGCQCFRSSDEYVQAFCLVERNGAILTRGNWHPLLKRVFDDHKCGVKEFTGLPSSVMAMVREMRNQVAHSDIEQTENDKLWESMRADFAFLIMHCFACMMSISTTPDPVRKAFADSFFQYETGACKAALDNKEVEKPKFTPFRVKLFCADESESQTAFYLDTRDSKDEAKAFKNEVAQIFLLDKKAPLRISYMGKYEDSAIRDPFKEISLTTPNCISELDLDSSIFHLVHVEVKWKVKLHIDLPGKTLEHDLLSDDTMQQIQQLVLDDTKWDRALLYSGKNPVNNKAKIGDVSVENIFKLFATDPMDKDRRDEYLSRI